MATSPDSALRVLIITDFYWPYLGGVEQHVRTLGRALAEAGHDVVVATLGRADLPADQLDGAVRIRRMRSTTQRFPRLFASTERPWAPPIPDPAIVVQLHRLITELRPDVVHGHDWLARSFQPLRRWSRRRFGTRFVTSLHYYTLSCARKDLMQAARSAQQTESPCTGPGAGKCLICACRHYGRVIGAVTAAGNALGATVERRGADAIITVSAATATGNGLNPAAASVHVIANFLPPSGARPDVDVDIDAYTDVLPRGEFILFVGDLRPMKGLDVLLAAYAELRSPPPLVLIGKTWPATPRARSRSCRRCGRSRSGSW
jgi:glycosyltransferase involved in cell wall biosynthesis